MNLLGVKVIHKSLGNGIVTELRNSEITIQFAVKTSKFTYPDIFETFIKAEDAEVQESIINNIHATKLAEDERRQEETLARKSKEESLSVIKQFRSKPRNIEDGFDDNYHVAYLARNPILTYQEVEKRFSIKIAGFGRGINSTPLTVVLISSVDKKKSGFVYHDHWTSDGDYIYSGEGKNGDQSMTSGNKAIMSAADEGKAIHLFVKFSPQEYYYQGIFILVDYIHEDDVDEGGGTRKEYKFRLRKAS